MRVARRFESTGTDFEPLQLASPIYRYAINPQPRGTRLLMIGACLSPLILGFVSVPAVAWFTKPAKVERPKPAPEPERKPIIRNRWQPPQEWKIRPDQAP